MYVWAASAGSDSDTQSQEGWSFWYREPLSVVMKVKPQLAIYKIDLNQQKVHSKNRNTKFHSIGFFR